ncbi:MAG: hypothetical protein DRJ47_10405 [Thermoprotei archaeon]|nr:MAG: hypothetical protein DRJ47_10405 [Thermoprotei archaeon]
MKYKYFLRIFLVFIIPFSLTITLNLFYKAYLGYKPYILEVEVDKKVYSKGDMVSIKVRLEENVFWIWRRPLQGRDVGIQINDPEDRVVFVDQARTGADGTIVFTFRISGSWLPGTYKVYVAVSGATTTGEFEVKEG